MRFQIILGPANSGKSARFCLQVIEEAAASPEEKFIILVPEQFSLQEQKRIVEKSKNQAVMNIDILSFNRLALKVFSELGISVNEVLDDTGKALILRKVLEECAPGLALYKNKVRMEGFIEEMKSLISELKTYGVKVEDLEKASLKLKEEDPELSLKLRDTALIFSEFNDEIENIYTTSEEVPDLFSRVLSRSRLLKGSHIYLDGFTGFTPVQYRIIEGFLKVCASLDCVITVPEEEIRGNCPESSLFYLPNETYKRLVDISAKAGIEAKTISYKPLSIEQAQSNLVNGPEGNRAQIFNFAGKNPKEEAAFAAEETLRLVREKGLRYREIAVVTSDMERYYPYLEKAFKKAEIPFFIDHKKKITNNRLARFVLCALDVVKERFSYDSVFSYLKCGLSGLSKEEIWGLDNYCVEFGIRGPVVWAREFSKNSTVKFSKVKTWDMEAVNAARTKVMKSISGFAAKARRGKNASDYKEAYERLFEDNDIKAQMEEISAQLKEKGLEEESEEYAQIFETIEDILKKAETLSKGADISLEDYGKILKNAILEVKIGLVPPTLDMVTIADLERSRLGKIRALFVVGANEGSLPVASSGSRIFSLRDRELLKDSFELAPTRLENFYAQRYYIYLMLNKPKEYLYLCHALKDESGQDLNPSSVYDDIGEYIPGSSGPIKNISSEGEFFYEEEEGLRALSFQIGEYARTGDMKAVNMDLLAWSYKKYPERVKKIADAAFYENTEAPLSRGLAQLLYGKTLKGSVSRFELFNQCPFRHFLRYGLRLSERPEFELKSSSLGSVYHSALEKYVNLVNMQGESIRTVEDEESHALAKEAAQAAINEEESGVFKASARNRFEAERTVEVVVKTTDAIREKIKKDNYDVGAAEARFKLKMSQGDIFTGVIDRIDIYDTGTDVYVNVVDYKTGSKSFSPTQAYEGTQLQLPVYMYAAYTEAERENPGKKVHPAGISYFLVKDEFEKAEDKKKEKSRVSGLFEEDKIKGLMDFSSDKLEETAEKIKAGDVSPRPLKEGDQVKACAYCEFKDICRFEEGKFKASARPAAEIDKEELEGRIYGGV